MNTIRIGISVYNENCEWIRDYLIGDNFQKGISRIKGSSVSNKCINEIEMRVCIKENIIQFTDYPNYTNID